MSPCTPFAELANILKPGASGRDIAELLDGRVSRFRALHWKAGRSMPPAWAVDLLKAKLAELHRQHNTIADKAKPGPGLKAGARNLAAYLATRR